MHSKGDLPTFVIIGMIIVIIGLAISIYFVSVAGKDIVGQRDVCKLSVLTRATAPTAAQSFVPLKCTTDKLCITSDSLFETLTTKDSCDQFIGEQGVRTIRLTGNTINQEQQLKRELAGSMYDCWSMMGQGKLDLFGSATKYMFGGGSQPACVICSRIAFSENVPDSLIQSALIGLDSYLQTTPIPGQSVTFLSAFNNQGTSTFASTEIVRESLSQLPNEVGSTKPVSLVQSNDRQIAFVFSQVHVDDTAAVLGRLGTAAAGATFVIPGAAKGASALFMGSAGIATVVVAGAAVTAIGVNNEIARGSAAGYCGKIESSSGNLRSGCSLVQALPYTVGNINGMCPGSIQGNP